MIAHILNVIGYNCGQKDATNTPILHKTQGF